MLHFALLVEIPPMAKTGTKSECGKLRNHIIDGVEQERYGFVRCHES